MRRVGILCIATVVVITACQAQGPAPAQVLRISITRDIATLDPTQVHQPSVDESLVRNLFDGLYRFENNLEEVPDLATAMPEVSADRKTWTFHLRPDARFGNGDLVTADDVIFSWSRAAQPHSADSVPFAPVVGYDLVQAGKEKRLSGLSAPDQKTVVAKLSEPAGWWLVELGLWSTYIVNPRVVEEHGANDWWKTPQGLNAGATGPFQLADWSPGV